MSNEESNHVQVEVQQEAFAEQVPVAVIDRDETGMAIHRQNHSETAAKYDAIRADAGKVIIDGILMRADDPSLQDRK